MGKCEAAGRLAVEMDCKPLACASPSDPESLSLRAPLRAPDADADADSRGDTLPMLQPAPGAAAPSDAEPGNVRPEAPAGVGHERNASWESASSLLAAAQGLLGPQVERRSAEAVFVKPLR